MEVQNITDFVGLSLGQEVEVIGKKAIYAGLSKGKNSFKRVQILQNISEYCETLWGKEILNISDKTMSSYSLIIGKENKKYEFYKKRLESITL